MRDVKICIIGAGSAVFSLDLVRDLCLTKSLWGSTVSFMDIDEQRLNAVYNLAKRYANEMKANFRFKKATKREEGLQDADFVIDTALVGGHKIQEEQREIAEKHGYYRGIGDVVSDYYSDLGSYHQLKFFTDLTREMEEKCPDAWLLQTSNPVFEGCNLITRETKIKVIGLCDGFDLGCGVLTDTLKLAKEEVLIEAPGFNHMIWMTKFHYKGENAYPLLDEWIAKSAEEYWKENRNYYLPADMSPAAVDMYRIFGLLPIADTARVGNWWYHTDLETKKNWYGSTGGDDSEVVWPLYLKFLENQLDNLMEVANNPSASVTENFPPAKSIQQHIPIIDALVNDNRGRFQVNVPNKNGISEIPSDVVIETPALVSKKGIEPLFKGKLPKGIMVGAMIPRMLRMELVLEAFLTGDRELLLQLILNDRRTKSLEQAKALLKDILKLPFNRSMMEHYK